MSRVKKFFENAILLTLTALLMRGVGLAFNVWLSNKVGAEALGLFSLISGVYGFALTLATSGIALAVTRMVAEALGHDDHSLVRASMKRCLTYAAFFGLLAFLLLFSFAEAIGIHWLKDARTVRPLKIMSLTLPLIALCSAMNGYFTAVRRVAKNAASQIAEQAVKIAVTVTFITTLLPDGIENACIALVLGGAVSEVLSFIVMTVMYLADKKRHIKVKHSGKSCDGVTKKLLGIALPVAFSTYARSGLLTLEHTLIPIGLKKHGANHERALATYGVLGSMAMPVILFPTALISSFSSMTIPEISDCIARGHKTRIKYRASRIWQFSLLFSIGVSGILICFSGELVRVLYSNEEAATYIRMLAPLIPIMYLDTTTDALLKGLGEQLYSMNINIIDAALSVLLVWLLVPVWGIYGYIFVIIAMEVLNFGMSATRMLNVSGMKPKIFSWVVKPMCCIVASAFLSKKFFDGFNMTNIPWLSLTLHIVFATLLYILFISLTRTVDDEDFEWLKGIFKKRPES